MTMKPFAGIAAMTPRRITSTVVAAIMLLLMVALPVLAEQASAESGDFTVSTIPEPAAVALFVTCYSLFVIRRRKIREARVRHIGVLGLFMLGCLVAAQTSMAAKPIVTNVIAHQREWPSFIVDIHYDVSDADGHTQTVSAAVSTNSGTHYDIHPTNFAGHIGSDIPVGTNKWITWDAGIDLPDFTSDTVRVRVTSDDGIPDGMALIPAGNFNMGTNNIPFDEQMSNAGPNHQVNISAFYMDKYEVTYTQWTNVYTWATNNYYTDLAAGSGKATNHPVQMVSWYDCVKWANARSEMEGKTPCYYTSTNLIAANIYKTGSVNLSNNWVQWSTNGYRLPTEAEWEKAARGGLSGRRFPWQDLNITHTNANYYSDVSYLYDTSVTRGYHPAFSNAPPLYTSPVGYFAPNGYELYDMAGNVWEWTWDWYDGAWYGNTGATQSDTRGPVSGSNRVIRGGAGGSNAAACRSANRNNINPVDSYDSVGFRLSLPAGQ